MKIISYSPYARGRSHENLITLIGSYLSQQRQKVDLLTCNGCFTSCERDVLSNWQKSFNKCFSCQSAQKKSTDFQGLNKLKMSDYLTADEIELSKQIISEASAAELKKLNWSGKVNIFDLCAGSFEVRFGQRDFAVNNNVHVNFARQLMLSALRQFIAVNKLVISGKYQLSLVPDGSDVLTCSFVCAARNSGASPVIFKYDRLDGNVFVINPHSHEIKVCENVPTDLSSLGNNYQAWPSEVHDLLNDIAAFLNFENEQLSLPLAN